MINWATLNKGVVIPETDPSEIQIEQFLKQYQQALQLHQKGQKEEAKQIYERIINDDLVENGPDTADSNQNLTMTNSSLVMLRFLVYKNYAVLLKDEFDTGGSLDIDKGKEAIKYYLMALDIDETEQTLWYRVGQLAHSIKNTRLARLAYEHGLYIIAIREKYPDQFDEDEFNMNTGSVLNFWNELEHIFLSGRLSPVQWKCLEGLCQVLVEIGDYHLCQSYMKLASQHFRGWPLLEKLQEKMDTFTIVNNPKSMEPVHIKLSKVRWSTLLKALTERYDELMGTNNDENPLYHHVPVVNRAIHIDVTARENIGHTDDNHRVEHTPNLGEGDIQMLETPPKQATEMEPEQKYTDSSVKKIYSVEGPTKKTIDEDPQMTNTSHIVTTSQQPLISKQKHLSADAHEDKKHDNSTTKIIIDLSMDDDDDEDGVTNTGISLETNSGGIHKDNENLFDDRDVPKPTLKRKRSTESILDNEDEEEESESEDKKATLRTSKRQKEKIENEETSRRKMLNEEDEHSQSIQDVFDRISTISNIKRHRPWHLPVALPFDESAMDNFWQWFDAKVSELTKRYAWDYDNTRTGIDLGLASSISTIESKNSSQFTIFEVTQPVRKSNKLQEESAVLQLIDSLNTENSGVVDSLLRVIVDLLNQDGQYDIDNSTADLFVDTVYLLGSDFVERYLFNNNDSDMNDHTQENATVKLTLRICERMIDKLINMIHTSLENYSSSSSTRKKSNAVKQTEKAAIRKSIELSDAWIEILERSILRHLSGFYLSKPPPHQDNNEQLEADKILLRYWFIRGKMAQCKDELDMAFEWYTRCEKVLDEKVPKDTVIDLRCRYDSVLSLDTIKKKLKSLEMGKYMLSAKAKFVNKEYGAIIAELSDAVESRIEDSQDRSNELCEMLPLLAKSYTEVGEHFKAWKCHIRILCYLIHDLVAYGVSQGSSEEYSSKDTDTIFFKHLKKIDSCLQDIVNLLLDTSLDYTVAVDNETTDSILIVLQMTVQYVFRHPDFIPLVNNFATPTAEPHGPSNTTRSSKFNSVVINAWVLAATLIQHCIPDDNSLASLESRHALVDMLISLHDELGERQICGVAKGAFLKCLLKLPPQENDAKYKLGIYQCYHCLYGVAFADDETDSIEEHFVTHGQLTQKAAEPLFALMVDSVVQRLNRGAQLKTDPKEVIDMIANLFDSLPTQNYNVRLNKNLIGNYLAQDVKINQSIDLTLKDSLLSAIPIDPKRSKLSPVYFKIFWIQGRIMRVQIKNRLKFNAEKNVEDLENAIELFTSHVVLNPYDVSGWAELGHCYASLADEELIWSAMNVKSHRGLIASYQKKAYHAFCRALYLLRLGESNKSLDSASMFDMYIKFGYLLYSIVCPPMKGAALDTKAIRRIMTADKQLSYSSVNPSDTRNAYKMALVMFNRALRFKSKDKWRCHLMIGNCYKKLGRPAKEVLQWYKNAVQNVPSKSGSDRIFEPIYKLYSALAKYLYKREIQPNDIVDYLDTESAENGSEQEETDNYETPPSTLDNVVTIEGDSSLVPVPSSDTTNDSPKHVQNDPYDIIIGKLAAIRRVDKHKWHHRPIYRSAWILYHVYNQAESAKRELLELFSLKSNSKSLTNMWKTNYERPGKFFEYVHQCTLLLIKLAKETKDIERLKLLKDKLNKPSSTVLLYADELASATEKAIIEAGVEPSVTLQHHPGDTEREGVRVIEDGIETNRVDNDEATSDTLPNVIVL
ncbi:hypothetical protein BDA99DRAFT_498736 [Phascolomyces articulosus]|uniref:Histone transcription regulator 3 homolog n=1 Tax=Phascolomyces articulosus TaxID=60185 RepID=A0AAD5K9J0_9FUNG|nr:hypothetical protein BDA99DRAFT_498736 [Phascolomyces articulosus]